MDINKNMEIGLVSPIYTRLLAIAIPSIFILYYSFSKAIIATRALHCPVKFLHCNQLLFNMEAQNTEYSTLAVK